jgi:hypothetical protein
MAPLPTIGNCVRCDLDWGIVSGVRSHSTFHVITDTTDIEQLGLDLGSAFDDATGNAWKFLYTGYQTEEILLTPLDGDSAGITVPLGVVLGGVGSGGIVPAVAAALSFRTLTRGPKGRGRIYMGPCGEGDIADGKVSVSIRDEVVEAWQDFDSNLAASSSAGSLGVASYTHAVVDGVTSISMRLPCATMRRRQDQLV